ncbi:MAG: DUF1800 domain-containing protein [Acidimicrobiales bacterium]|nr:DUF1800 domain-containing protein [Acidimicrobiales bacterium]
MPSDFSDVAHLLRRSGFGGRRSEIESLSALDWPHLVDHVLDISDNPAVTAGVPNLDEATTDWGDRYVGMTHYWFERARTVPKPIQEKVALFWHGVLCSALDKVNKHYLMFDQIQLFRTKGMGDLVELYQSMAVQPAMLLYLDNEDNVKGSPNENFARELMELFLLGQGHYTEDDVQASARAWTGHGLNRWDAVPREYVFHADRHDNDLKTFMGITNNWNGPDIITHILLGPKQRDAARFIATKMWSFFAYPNPDPSVVEVLADALVAGGMRVDALLRAIFLHPEFRSSRARNALVRSPIEFTVAAMRHAGLTSDDIDPQWYIGEMGQSMYDPPNVAGWKQNGYWISSSAMWAKARFASNLRWQAHERELLADSPDLGVEQSVDRALDTFGVFDASQRTRSSLIDFVTTERATSRWAEPPGLIFLSLLTPEFQLA